MDFTENELHELVTALADQKTFYRRALTEKIGMGARKLYQEKLAINERLYKHFQSALLAHDTAEKL